MFNSLGMQKNFEGMAEVEKSWIQLFIDVMLIIKTNC